MALLSVFGLTAIIGVCYLLADRGATRGMLILLWAGALGYGALGGL